MHSNKAEKECTIDALFTINGVVSSILATAADQLFQNTTTNTT